MELSKSDLAISSRDGLVAVVEVRNPPSLTRSDAEEFVAREFAGRSVGSRFVIVLSQERAFVWRHADNSGAALEFISEFSVREVFNRYLKVGAIRGRLREQDLRMLAFDWLSSLAAGDGSQGGPAVKAMRSIGLLAAMRGGTVTAAAA